MPGRCGRRARLRGHDGTGGARTARLAVPVLETAFERSLGLAASMESRGYGRAVQGTSRDRRPPSGSPSSARSAWSPGSTGCSTRRPAACSGCRCSPWVRPRRRRASPSAPRASGGRVTGATGGSGPRPSPPWRRGGAGERARRRRRTGLAGHRPAGARGRPARPAPRRRLVAVLVAAVPAWLTAAPARGTDDHLRPRVGDVCRRDPLPAARRDARDPGGGARARRRSHRQRKSTLLRTINGLVPHFSGGTLNGRVTVDGLDTAGTGPATSPPSSASSSRTRATFVTDVVEDEVAYGMETMGLDPTAIRRRVEETLDLFGLTPLRGRPLGALSGGQQQRAAIAALFAAGPAGARARRADLGARPGGGRGGARPRCTASCTTSASRWSLAEHRLERVVHHADRVVLVDGGRTSALLDPAEAMLQLADLSAGRGALPPRRVGADAPVDPRRAAPRPRRCVTASSTRRHGRCRSCG